VRPLQLRQCIAIIITEKTECPIYLKTQCKELGKPELGKPELLRFQLSFENQP
jgi:hypothetical protein